jgi:hypothetical protein
MANAITGDAMIIRGVARGALHVHRDVEGGFATDLVGDEKEFGHFVKSINAFVMRSMRLTLQS